MVYNECIWLVWRQYYQGMNLGFVLLDNGEYIDGLVQDCSNSILR